MVETRRQKLFYLFNIKTLKYICTIRLLFSDDHAVSSQFASVSIRWGVYKIAYSVKTRLRYIPDVQENTRLSSSPKKQGDLELSKSSSGWESSDDSSLNFSSLERIETFLRWNCDALEK